MLIFGYIFSSAIRTVYISVRNHTIFLHSPITVSPDIFPVDIGPCRLLSPDMSQCIHLAIIFKFWFAKFFSLVLETLIFPVLYGCETWSLILREERRLRVFEHKVLRRIFGPRRDEVTVEWRKLHDEFNLLKPNDIYICRTAALTSRRYILNIYSTNIHTEYFKHAA